MKTCSECKFWHLPNGRVPDGDCRRNPPQVFAVAVPQAGPQLKIHGPSEVVVNVQVISQPPKTPPTFWCGQFEAKDSTS